MFGVCNSQLLTFSPPHFLTFSLLQKHMGKKLALLFSLITHPLLMITYALVIYLKVNPFAFGVPNIGLKMPLVLMVFVLTFFFPALVVFLLKKLDFVDSISLNTAKERIIPYIGTAVFFLWMYITTRSNPEIPTLFKSFVLGSIISLFLVFFVNNFSKISAHMAGIGGIVVFCFSMMYGLGGNTDMTSLLGNTLGSRPVNLPSIAILVGGLVATSRLSLKAHSYQEIIGGLVVGVLGQIIAMRSYF